MAISLRAKNDNLTAGQKFSYLVTNNSSAVSSLAVTNSDGFIASDYLLLGNLGNETSEIVQIDSVASATHTLTLKVATLFAHPESTKITIIKYNKVRFYQTAAATFSASENYLGEVDVQADSLYTVYQDSINSTGYGWFKFYNSTNLKISAVSNAIPYSNFANQSISTVLNSFYSLLNSKERSLISDKDALSYLNEAYAIVVSELNLVNPNYNVPADKDFSIVASTSEYALPDDFSKVLSLYNGTDDVEVPFIALSEVPDWDSVASNEVKYSLRGEYLVISPEPTASITYTMKYQKKSDILSSYYSNISLPDNMHYMLVDFMMSRAAIKLGSGKEATFLKLFQNNIQRMKVTSFKRSNEISSFGIADNANV